MKNSDLSIQNADFSEQVGISSYEMLPFLNDFKANKIELHSFMVIRDGKVAFEAHRLPYGRYVRQAMFSVSKVFVAVAIGFAQDEGLLSLESKVVDFFPEFRPSKRDKILERLTIHHLLSMTSGKKIAPLSPRDAKSRLKAFFGTKWSCEPGKLSGYTVENICVCCDILKKVTGTTITEYLTPRLYEPLGYETAPLWEKDSTGIEGGFWGLYLSPDELARLSLCLLNDGKYAGKQVIPADFVKEMLTVQSKDVPFQNKLGKTDYGYFIRTSNLKNSFMIDGTFSQFSVMVKDYNTVFICTCSHIVPEDTMDVITNHFPRMITHRQEEPPKEKIDIHLDDISVIFGERNEFENEIKGKVLKFRGSVLMNAVGVPFSMLPLVNIYLAPDKGDNINNIVLDFTEDTCLFSWDEGRDHNMIHCAMDGSLKYDKMHISGVEYNVVCAAAWLNENTLEIQVRPLESINERRICLEFGAKNSVTLRGSSVTSSDEIYDEIGDIAAEYLQSDEMYKPLSSLTSNFSFILNSPLKGKIN